MYGFVLDYGGPWSDAIGSATYTSALLIKRVKCRNDTFPVNGVDPLSHFVFIVGVSFHVREDPGLVRPQVVVGTEEKDRKLADVVPHPQDIFRNVLRVADFSGPPSDGAIKIKFIYIYSCILLRYYYW